MDADRQRDFAIRQAAFRFLDELTLLHGDSLPWDELRRGFDHNGERVPLVSIQGIFKPRVLRLPLSIRTAAVEPGQDRPYDDGLAADGSVVYRYRGTNPKFHQNVWLREAMQHKVPMVYFHGTVRGRYVAAWPVFITDDNPAQLAFRVDVEASRIELPAGEAVGEEAIERRYATRLTRQRLHQGTFRDRVLKAYREQCAICTLRHVRLLDAAHIVPDADLGEPRVSNGISLCKLHHGAYDARILGIRPDLVVEVREAVRRERDGPMLLHGLQGAHGKRIHAPRGEGMRPSAEALAQRYESFLRSA